MTDSPASMPLFADVREPRLSREHGAASLPPMIAGLCGAALIAGLAVAAKADPVAAVSAAVLSAALGVGFSWREAVVARRAAVVAVRQKVRPVAAGLPFEAAVEQLPIPLVLVGRQDDAAAPRILYANGAARAVLRLSSAGEIPLVSVLRNPEVIEAVDESLCGGGARTVSFEESGALERSWDLRTMPLKEAGGREPVAALVMRDATDLHRAERLRADFLANASHELRTPLASLTGFIETLRGHARDDPGARERFLDIMAAQADRMGRLIADLLSLSRIELNEHVPPTGVCDLAAVVRDTVDAMAPVAAERRVTIALELSDSAQVIGDRDQLVQVAQNLIDNALKYSPPTGETVAVSLITGLTLGAVQAHLTAMRVGEGGGRMSLLTPERRAEERFALLRVTDHGPGMRREHLPRLAERFYRVEGQKSGARSGTGLGLAIVKHILNRHRGGLAVESAPGAGATFSAYLPLAPAPSEVAGQRDETVVIPS